MSSTEENRSTIRGGVIGSVFAVIGAIATVVVVGAGAMLLLAPSAQECSARGEPALVCAGGALGLVDLGASAEKDRALEAAKADAAAKTAAAGDAEKRAATLDARVKELETTLAGAQAATEQMRGELGRRDAKIADLTEKLAAATRKPTGPTPAPAPGARPPAGPPPIPRPAPHQ